MRGLVTLLTVYALIAVVLLSGCDNGRWVVHDLSKVSHQFNGPHPVAITTRSPAAATR